MHITTKALKHGFLLALLSSTFGCMKESREEVFYNFCINEISSKLKAPATAIFSSFSKTDIKQKIKTYPNDGVLRATWIVNGHVDSQNGFGALIRSNFSCEWKQWKEEIKFEKARIF